MRFKSLAAARKGPVTRRNARRKVRDPRPPQRPPFTRFSRHECATPTSSTSYFLLPPSISLRISSGLPRLHCFRCEYLLYYVIDQSLREDPFQMAFHSDT